MCAPALWFGNLGHVARRIVGHVRAGAGNRRILIGFVMGSILIEASRATSFLGEVRPVPERIKRPVLLKIGARHRAARDGSFIHRFQAMKTIVGIELIQIVTGVK